jgi:hypothetical protein
MQVGFGAVRAGELSIGILLRNLVLSLGRPSSRRGGPAWGAGQNASAALRADHMGRCIALGHHGSLRHQRALRIGRVHAGLGHDSTRGHRAEDGWGAAAGRGRGGSDGLRVRGGRGRLGDHTRRSARVGLLRVRVVAHDGVVAAARILLRRGRVAGHGARGARRIGGCGRPRSVGIAPVGALLHNRVAWLKRWQRVGRGCRRLSLVVVRVVRVMRVLLLRKMR